MTEALPPAVVVMQMLTGAWLSQTISAVTRLDVPELVGKHGPLSARELTAHGVDADAERLQRALRACATAGIFSESEDGRFGPTPLSDALTLASPSSVKRFAELIGDRWWPLIGSLSERLRAGDAPEPAWDREEPAQTRRFGEAMKSSVQATLGVLAGYDFSRAQTVVDVGGGFGHVATAILRRHPHARAVVLDLPNVIAEAEQAAAAEDPRVRARLSFVAGDMFADVPAGDLYILKAIVHDWDDARCVRVLRNCRARMRNDGRILCVDSVLPPLGDTGCASAKLLDMLMLVSLPGKERTETEWRALYDAAGLRVLAVTLVNPRSGQSIIEGAPRG
jgi:SAM-dependent methyltransferase